MDKNAYRLGLEEAKDIIINRLIKVETFSCLTTVFADIFDALEKKILLTEEI